MLRQDCFLQNKAKPRRPRGNGSRLRNKSRRYLRVQRRYLHPTATSRQRAHPTRRQQPTSTQQEWFRYHAAQDQAPARVFPAPWRQMLLFPSQVCRLPNQCSRRSQGNDTPCLRGTETTARHATPLRSEQRVNVPRQLRRQTASEFRPMWECSRLLQERITYPSRNTMQPTRVPPQQSLFTTATKGSPSQLLPSQRFPLFKGTVCPRECHPPLQCIRLTSRRHLQPSSK